MSKPKQRRLKCGCVRQYGYIGIPYLSYCEEHEKANQERMAKYKREQTEARLNVDMCLFELDLKTVKGASFAPDSCKRFEQRPLEFKYAYATELFQLWQLAKQRGATS